MLFINSLELSSGKNRKSMIHIISLNTNKSGIFSYENILDKS